MESGDSHIGSSKTQTVARPPAFFDCRRPDRGEYQRAHIAEALLELPGIIVRAYYGSSDQTVPPAFGMNISFTFSETPVAIQVAITDPKELEALANEIGLTPGEDLATKLVNRRIVALKARNLAYPPFGFYVKK